MGQVERKVAIVTGGASGIELACTAVVARKNAKVVVSDLDDTGGQAMTDKIEGPGERRCSSTKTSRLRKPGQE